MLDFESPNTKPEPERNLRCQPLLMVTISCMYVVIAARRTEHPTQKRLPFCFNNTVATAAQIDLMTLIQIPRSNFRIFSKVYITRPPILRRIEVSQPIALPAPEESIHQVHSHLRFILEAIAPLELRYLINKLAKSDHLHPCDGREQLGVMSVRQQATLPLTQSHALFLMAEPRYRAAVVHQNDIANSPNQLSLRNKKMPPSVNWTAQGRLRRGTRSGRRNGVWLRRASRSLFCLIKKKVWSFNLYRCRNAPCAPVAYALNTKRHLVTKNLGNLCGSAKAFDEFYITFNFVVHANILNVAFR